MIIHSHRRPTLAPALTAEMDPPEQPEPVGTKVFSCLRLNEALVDVVRNIDQLREALTKPVSLNGRKLIYPSDECDSADIIRVIHETKFEGPLQISVFGLRDKYFYPSLGAFCEISFSSYVIFQRKLADFDTAVFPEPADVTDHIFPARIISSRVEDVPLYFARSENDPVIEATCYMTCSPASPSSDTGSVLICVGMLASGLIISSFHLVDDESGGLLEFETISKAKFIPQFSMPLVEETLSVLRRSLGHYMSLNLLDSNLIIAVANRADNILISALAKLDPGPSSNVPRSLPGPVAALEFDVVKLQRLCIPKFSLRTQGKIPMDLILLMGQSNMAGRGDAADLQLSIDGPTDQVHNLLCGSDDIRPPTNDKVFEAMSTDRYNELVDITTGKSVVDDILGFDPLLGWQAG
jgi:hypothetical protein